MKQITLINNSPLSVKEYNGQRVVTFKDIDTLHQRAEGTAKRNFNANKNHLIERVDYYRVCSYEIRTSKLFDISDKNTRKDMILLTESGYLMLVKSFNDDIAWAVQRALVNSYFKGKINPAPQSFLEECGVIKPVEEKQTDEDIAKIFLESLSVALNSGKYYLSQKWKRQSNTENKILLGIYDDNTITLIPSVAYSIYADFVGLPFNALSMSKQIRSPLVRCGLILPREAGGKQKIKGKEYCIMRISIPQANALRGYELIPERV